MSEKKSRREKNKEIQKPEINEGQDSSIDNSNFGFGVLEQVKRIDDLSNQDHLDLDYFDEEEPYRTINQIEPKAEAKVKLNSNSFESARGTATSVYQNSIQLIEALNRKHQQEKEAGSTQLGFQNRVDEYFLNIKKDEEHFPVTKNNNRDDIGVSIGSKRAIGMNTDGVVFYHSEKGFDTYHGYQKEEKNHKEPEPEELNDEEVIVNAMELADHYALMELKEKDPNFCLENESIKYQETLDKHFNIIKNFKRNKDD